MITYKPISSEFYFINNFAARFRFRRNELDLSTLPANCIPLRPRPARMWTEIKIDFSPRARVLTK